MAQTILYYPTINIQDSAWLRNAVLYWDEVSSIVPYEDYPNFSPEVLFLQRSGVYKAVYPQKLFSSEFAEDFCNSIVKRIAAYEARTVNNENTNSRVRVHKNKVYAPALHELIHYRKLPPQLLGYFENKRYINDYNVDGWMEIDSKIAQIYMRTLAEYSIKCSDKDIVLGTDTFTHSREIYSPSRNHANLQAQCCKINIENCLPQPSMDVRFEDILEFKSTLIVLATFFGSSAAHLIVLIAAFSWVGTARAVRAKVLQLHTQPFIESCRILGYSRTYIAVRHILPNLSDVLLSRFLLGVNSCIMMESTLSFLGLGDLYRPTWETMVNFAYKRGAFLRGAYQYLLAPGVCVMLLCLAFYLISLWLTARKETILEG